MTTPTADPQVGPKILIVLNERNAISVVVTYLTKLGYELSYASNVIEAVNAVTASRPDLVLVSWQLKSSNVRSVVNLLTGRLKLGCIVFGEENDPSIASEMTKAGFAYTLPPPFYGPTAHFRIQEILSKRAVFSRPMNPDEKNAENLEKTNSSDLTQNLMMIYGDKVPSKTNWEKDSPEENNANLWKGTSTSKKGKKSFYYFKGENAPRYNKKQKYWETDPGGAFYVEKHEKKSGINIIKSDTEDSKSKSIRKKLKAAVRKLMKDAARKKDEEKKSHKVTGGDYSHLLARCLKDSLKVYMNPSGDKKPLSQVNEVVAILVNSFRFKGYIIAAGSKFSLDELLMENIFTGMKENMAMNGLPLAPFKVIKFGIDPVDFFPWSKKTAEFVVSSQQRDEEIAFAFLPIKRIPEYSHASVSGYIAISVVHGLVEGEPLLFDAYLHLSKNEKFVRYMKKGSYFDAQARAKYNEFRVANIFIKAEDLGAFFIYCVKARIKGLSIGLDQEAA